MVTIGSAAAWPLASRAQQQVPVIGYLNPGSIGRVGDRNAEDNLKGFRRGLEEEGYVEGRNLAIEYRWAEGRYERLRTLADDLVRRRVMAIAALGSSAPCLAAKAATSTIPIVFQTGADPVVDGLVASMNRPGGNVTGVSRSNVALNPKRLELLHEAVPKATKAAILVNAGSPRAERETKQTQDAARSLRLEFESLKIAAESELDNGFDLLSQKKVAMLIVSNDPTMSPWTERIAALTLRHALPAIFSVRSYVSAGGLMSYDSSVTDSFRQAGVYTGRVLKGEKPADLPVLEPTKFEFILNLKTAKALGLDIPLKLHAFADEVIE